MMQASTSPASFFLRVIFREGPSQAQFKMYRYFGKAAFVLAMAFLWSGPVILAQQSKVAAAPRSGLSPEKALSLAEQGRCQASIALAQLGRARPLPGEHCRPQASDERPSPCANPKTGRCA